MNYEISALLSNGMQIFANLDADQLKALGDGINSKEMAVPVAVTTDGILIDGHQRLLALQARGETHISDGNVRIVAGVDQTNALEWSVRLNVQRRHLTMSEKQKIARDLQSNQRFSQKKIADLFSISRPAVSQWLKNDTEKPATVVGANGVVQKATRQATRAKASVKPGYDGMPLVEKLMEQLTNDPPSRKELTTREWQAMETRLGELVILIGTILNARSRRLKPIVRETTALDTKIIARRSS